MNTRGKQRNRKIRYSLYDYLKMLFTFVHLMLYLKSETNNFGEIQMAHTDYYYEFGDHMPDGSPDTRWQTAPARGLNRTHDALVNGAIGVMDGARAVKDFAGNTTFNPLPYGEYARSAYDGMQNLYGNALDDGMNSVIDYVNPQPDMMSGGPMSRNGYRHNIPRFEQVSADEYMALATEAEMGSSPYQEQDTGPGLMMSGGPMTRNSYRHHPEGSAPPNASFLYEPYYADDDYDNLKAMQFNSNIREPEGAPVKFSSKSFEQEMMDANNGVPMTRQDFAEYNNARFEEPQKTQRPQSDWAKWKASMNSGRS